VQKRPKRTAQFVGSEQNALLRSFDLLKLHKRVWIGSVDKSIFFQSLEFECKVLVLSA
jgi:hypothetical protein